jgi:hypothetical protein
MLILPILSPDSYLTQQTAATMPCDTLPCMENPPDHCKFICCACLSSNNTMLGQDCKFPECTHSKCVNCLAPINPDPKLKVVNYGCPPNGWDCCECQQAAIDPKTSPDFCPTCSHLRCKTCRDHGCGRCLAIAIILIHQRHEMLKRIGAA